MKKINEIILINSKKQNKIVILTKDEIIKAIKIKLANI